MTVTVASSNWLVPNNWRTTLEPRVANFSTPELDEALCVIKTVLEGRSDAEIQSLALSLVHLVAPDSTIELKGVPLGFVFEPRIVFQLYGKGLNSEQTQGLTLLESIALGGLIALNRACRVMEQVKSSGNAPNACTAIASASACGEWLYMVSSLKSNANALEHLFPRQVRIAAKKKVSAKASSKSTAYWEGKLAPAKQKMVEAYEAGKPWASTKEAAEEISNNIVTDTVKHDKLYKWLLAYVNGKQF
jgi:hypothetical protein